VELTVRAHLDLLTAAMADQSVDVMLLGRPGNARWVTGAETLWLAGSRAFSPGCVVVREPGSVHLLSTTDSGVPADVVPAGNLFPISWNPANLMGALAVIPGLPEAALIGVDSITPTMEQLLGATFPTAELVDGESLVRAVRRVKSPDDIAALRAAVALAEECLGAVVDALTPGVTERALVGVFEFWMAANGVTTPAFEGTFVVAESPPRTLASDRALEAGDLVQLRGGVLRDGWEGWLSRTAVYGKEPTDAQRDAFASWRRETEAVLAACTPGTGVGALRGAASDVTVDGVGMGHEELADHDVLEAGMVLAVEVRSGDVLGSEVVLVTPSGHEELTGFPHPLS
jgi:Xaa-Pro aminopeptidase